MRLESLALFMSCVSDTACFYVSLNRLDCLNCVGVYVYTTKRSHISGASIHIQLTRTVVKNERKQLKQLNMNEI